LHRKSPLWRAAISGREAQCQGLVGTPYRSMGNVLRRFLERLEKRVGDSSKRGYLLWGNVMANPRHEPSLH